MRYRMNQLRIPVLAFAFLSAGAFLSWKHYFEESFAVNQTIWFALFTLLAAGLSVLLIMSMRAYGSEIREVEISRKNYEQLSHDLQSRLESMQNQLDEWVEQSTVLISSASVNDVCEKVMDMLEKSLGADQGSIMLLDPADKCLSIVASRGIPDEIASKIHLQLGERIAGVAASENREFLIVGDFENYPLFHDLEENPIIKSAIICPIVYQHQVLGVLNISRTLQESVFTPEDLKRAKNFAKHVGIAIHHAGVCQQLEKKGEEIKEMYRQLKVSHIEMLDNENQLEEKVRKTKRLKAS